MLETSMKLTKYQRRTLMLIKRLMTSRIRQSCSLKVELESFKVNPRLPKDQIFCRKKKLQITQKIFRKFSKKDVGLRKKLNWKQWHSQISLITEILKIYLNSHRISTRIYWSKRKSTKLTHRIIFKKSKLKSKTRKEHFCWSGSSMSTENSNSNLKDFMSANT